MCLARYTSPSEDPSAEGGIIVGFALGIVNWTDRQTHHPPFCDSSKAMMYVHILCACAIHSLTTTTAAITFFTRTYIHTSPTLSFFPLLFFLCNYIQPPSPHLPQRCSLVQPLTPFPRIKQGYAHQWCTSRNGFRNGPWERVWGYSSISPLIVIARPRSTRFGWWDVL